MALKDIEKLREKVKKDPNSKLFVPLAEECRKAGMLDEAISVLLSGLERQPGYMSARVSLGKIYLEKGMIAEAKEEFERVVGVIPDNLFAHKKLAHIYSELGDTDRAIIEYRTVLKLNPIDEDALSNLEALSGKSPESEVEEILAPAPEDELEKSISEPKTDSELPVSDIESAIQEESISFEGLNREEETAVKVPTETEEKAGLDFGAADSFIAEGNYSKAMAAYREMLSVDPMNNYVLQRIEELKTLLKLLGKGNEAVVAKLEAFFEGLKKRKDEFLRNP